MTGDDDRRVRDYCLCFMMTIVRSLVIHQVKSSHSDRHIHNSRGKRKGNVKRETLRMKYYDVLYEETNNQFTEISATNS